MNKDLYPSLSASSASAPRYPADNIPPPSYDQIYNIQLDASNLNQFNHTTGYNPTAPIQSSDHFQVDHYDVHVDVSELNAGEAMSDEIEIVDSKHIPSLNLTKDEARNILLVYAQNKNNIFISQRAVKKMEITNIDHSYVHAFRLDTFTEKRSSVWKFTKYKSGRIDDQSLSPTGVMPTIWEVQSHHIEPILFQYKETVLQVPHSEYIQPCHKCIPSLHSCSLCSGNNKLKYYLNCRITHKNHRSELYSEPTIIPDNLLPSASGDFVYTKQGDTVKPINYIQNDEISHASEKLIDFHKNKYKEEKLIAQRCHVRIIPVITVSFKYNEISDRYFIYGNDLAVHCPNFPTSTCLIM